MMHILSGQSLMRKLIYFIALIEPRSPDQNELEHLMSLVKNQDTMSYSIHFSEEAAFTASKHISYDVIIACAYVPESSIEYQVDRLVIRPSSFNLRHIHGYYPDKNNLSIYITNPYFDVSSLPNQETISS